MKKITPERKKEIISAGKKALAAVTCAAAVMGSSAPAFAANSALKNQTVTGTTTTFDKYLVMDRNANVPNVTFSYTVEGTTAHLLEDTNTTNLTVRKGIGTPAITDTAFAAGDETWDSAQSNRTTSASKGANATTKYADQIDIDPTTDAIDSMKANQKYAVKPATVDFTAITYSEPGVYRYKITENASDEKGITIDTKERYLDVYVDSDNDGKLSIKGYVMHRNDDSQAIGSTGTGENNPDYKNEGFTNLYTTYDFDITKSVTGNQGFKDQYFKYHVKITNADQGIRLFLTPNDGSESTYTTEDTVAYSYNETTGKRNGGQKRFVAAAGTTLSDITVSDGHTHGGLAITDTDNNGTLEFDVYLKDGDSLRVNGMTSGTKYVITEEYQDYDASASQRTVTQNDDFTIDEDGYGTSTALDLTAAAGQDKTNTTAEQTLTADVTNDYVNDRSGVLPTGYIHNYWKEISLTGLAIGGAFAFTVYKKKKKEAEEAAAQA